MSLGHSIRQRRKSQNLTLQQLAQRIDADSGNLSRIERGAQGVSEALLHKLCTALNCTPAFLYSHPDNALSAKYGLAATQPQEFV
jgi:amino-acid N-acetyltransferase